MFDHAKLGRLLPLLLATVLSCSPAQQELTAGTTGSRPQPIINGTACVEGRDPTTVALIFDGKMTIFGATLTVRTVMCTGTLIAPDVVLTAAHCLDTNLLTGGMGSTSDEAFYISFTDDLTSLVMSDPMARLSGTVPDFPADAVKATAWVANPGFTFDLLKNFQGGLSNLNDVALVFLDTALTEPEPAVVITRDEASQLAKDKEVTISGWGQQTNTARNPLQPPPPGTVGVKICATSFINELAEHEMQIGAGTETSRKCHGDSGGPSYMEVTTDHARTVRVVGITSHAYDKTDCAKGGVDTRVDAWLDWIDGEMQGACQDGTRVWCEVPGIIPPSYYDPPPTPDLGPDGMLPDGSAAGDASVDPPVEEGGGCECRLGRGRCVGSAGILLVLVAVGALARRRRRLRR